MKIFSSPFSLFLQAHQQDLQPTLLDAPLGNSHLSSHAFLGIKPFQVMEVLEGKLYVNKKRRGEALDIFDYLKFSCSSQSFFPAYMGCFAYEFSRHFGLPTHPPQEGLPEAFFYGYEEGFVWEKAQLIENSSLLQPLSCETLSLATLPPRNIISVFEHSQFLTAIEEIQQRIRQGIVYQVNLSKQFHASLSFKALFNLYHQMQQTNPSPFMGLIGGADWFLASGSPERLFALHNGIITARPIAGTRPRGKEDKEDEALKHQLLQNKKECAEHAMLVDLVRNDIAKIALPQSVAMTESYTVEYYSHVMHIVSEIRGRTQAPLSQIMASIFPGGTITGAPKESVMQTIKDLEPVPRGFYTGSLGYISAGYGVDFNILIRSIYQANQQAYFSAGAGIVINSDKNKEALEIDHKAKNIRALLSGLYAPAKAIKEPNIQSVYPSPSLVLSSQRPSVLFIENHDSFSYNIIQALSSLGAQVEVVEHNQAPFTSQHTHWVLGPGPGNPYTAGKLLNWVQYAIEQKKPTLGVCLGHQALALSLGAVLEPAQQPIHGEAHAVYHHQKRLFKGIPSPSRFTRYHSLVISQLPSSLSLEAWTENQSIMAFSHPRFPLFGVQFHPESFLSEYGIQLLANFLNSQ